MRPSILDTLSALGAGFTELIRAGQERLAVAAAQRTGVTDVNEITNLVFFGRHPELEGRQIRNDETELAQEWIDIRDTIVRPAMDGPTVR